jgi:hypothetical protein
MVGEGETNQEAGLEPGQELVVAVVDARGRRRDLAARSAAGSSGIAVAWWLRRYTTLSIRNLYGAATMLCALAVAASTAALWAVAAVLAPLAILAASASLMGRRWRLSDLGAGEELRRYEQDRRWIWRPAALRRAGERVWIATQGEIVRDRSWPERVEYVPMTRDGAARLPRRAGQHVAAFGATGSGKTTSVLRAAAGRTLKDHAALLWVDPKGDPLTGSYTWMLWTAVKERAACLSG